MGGVVIEVMIQYVEGCPHFDETYQLVSGVLETNDLRSVLKTRLVSSAEEAEDLGFVGSPTLLIDGVDPFADKSSRVGLACRIYGSGADRSGVPPKNAVETALLAS
ncbi:MAG: thioredoxin family protein [Acidobacteria bacterium]|nr:thioredoxin family protein [Acidobacteriota bacterium]